MRGARSSILESMKWAVQVRRAAIAVRHHVHFNSDVFNSKASIGSFPAFLLLPRLEEEVHMPWVYCRQPPSFAAYGVPLADLITGGQCTSLRVLPSTARSMMAGRAFLVLAGACQFGHGVGGFTANLIHPKTSLLK